MEIRHILCPVDFSDFSQRTVAYATALSRWYRSRLTLLHIHHVPVSSMALFAGGVTSGRQVSALSPADRKELLEQLKRLLHSEDTKNVPLEFSVVEGDVTTELLAEAASADLIVMGTHGRSGLDRLVLGSVAAKVLRKVACPVLLIPPGSPDANRAVPVLFHHILAAVDFRDVSLHALRYAISLAEEADAHLTILHVTDIPRELAQWAREDREGSRYVARWKRYAREHVRRLVADAARVYCHVDERVETGEPHREIVRAAVEQRSSLIVLGKHTTGVMERLFVGSTAEHVVRRALCPVLAVPAP